MVNASIQIDLPELPDAIRSRIVSHHRNFDIPEHLRALEVDYPGMLDAIVQTIDMLEAYPGVESTSIDCDEDDALFPVTVWARTEYSGDERFRHIVNIEAKSDEILQGFPELVLVAVL